MVIGPSNPLISIAPILKVIGPNIPRGKTVAISPIVGGVALKGPTAEMLIAMGSEASPVAVARIYTGVARTFVLDTRDARLVSSIEELGYRVVVCDTVMKGNGVELAAAILAALTGAGTADR